MIYLAASTAVLGNADGVETASEPGQLSATHQPAAATQATCGFAALANTRHICKAITATIACAGTAQTPIAINLRDGGTGAGTILWSGKLSAPVNGSVNIALTNLSIVGSINTAMTLEFVAAGLAATEQTVNLSIFNVTGQ